MLSTPSIKTNPIYSFDFNSQQDWKVVDDGVMGGKSEGEFSISEIGMGLFSGNVSLENNGGFSSLRRSMDAEDISDYKQIVLRLKGDGKSYQFRLKANRSDYFSYVYAFPTSGEWEEVRIPLKDFYPSFRGRRLDLTTFPGKQIEEMTFLIANKKAEKFELLIDWIAAI